MKIIKATYEIMDNLDGAEILKKIERCGRVCYKSEDKITDESAEKFVRGIIKRGHESVLEHVSFSVRFIVDRGVSHEIVRHRLASYSQESTRYCNYSNNKFGNEITVVEPCFFKKDLSTDDFDCLIEWNLSCQVSEAKYFNLLEYGCTPQEARAVLPNSLKTELVMTANLREWRAVLRLRASKLSHPQMQEVMRPLLFELKEKIPIVFDDVFEEVFN